jgi:hypothetical protein
MEPRPTLVTPEEIRQFDAALDSLFAPDEGHPCDECKALLMAFAAARPNDFAFVTPSDLVDPSQCAFQGIPEWDAFIERFSACELCNA